MRNPRKRKPKKKTIGNRKIICITFLTCLAIRVYVRMVKGCPEESGQNEI